MGKVANASRQIEKIHKFWAFDVSVPSILIVKSASPSCVEFISDVLGLRVFGSWHMDTHFLFLSSKWTSLPPSFISYRRQSC